MLAGRAKALAEGLTKVFSDVGVSVTIPYVESLLGIFFLDFAPKNYEESKISGNSGLYSVFFNSMLKRGVALAPGSYEVIFPSLAHTWDDIEWTIDIASAAAGDVADFIERSGH